MYVVKWEIEIDAESRLSAAKQALEIMQDKNSIATLFEVRKDIEVLFHTVDLME